MPDPHLQLIECALDQAAAVRVTSRVDMGRFLLCLYALPPAAVPRGWDVSQLAWALVTAFATGRTQGLRLPTRIARHVADWYAPATPCRS